MPLLTAWLGRTLSFLLFHSPASLRRALGALLAFLWFDVLRIRRDVVLSNLQIAFPAMSRGERLHLARRSLRAFFWNVVDYCFLPWLTRENYQRYFVFENEALLDRALARGKGVFLLTLHLGHGDLACAALSLRGRKVTMISKFFKLKWLNDLWFGMRARLGTQFIAPRDSSYAILKALKSGAAVVLPLDQFTGPPIGVRTKFFGHETGTAAGLAIMAERSGAPVLAVYTYRNGEGKHVLVFSHEIPIPQNPHRDLEVTTSITQTFNDALEQFVRLYPEQWMWIHKRWKKFVVT